MVSMRLSRRVVRTASASGFAFLLTCSCSQNGVLAFTQSYIPRGLSSYRQPSCDRLRNRPTRRFSTYANETIFGVDAELIASVSPQTPLRDNGDSSRNTLNSLAMAMSEKIGTVNDDRLVFPELCTGEVPNMFSTLEYIKTKDGKVVSATRSAGSTLGAAALVAGSTVGAGVLALPTVTATCGFLPSAAAMGVVWGYMTTSGLLIAELSVNRMGETGRPVDGLLDLLNGSLGKRWGIVGSASYLFLHYAIVVACLSQGGASLKGILDTFGVSHLSSIPGIGQLLLAGSCGLALYVAKPSVVERIRTLMLLGAGASFLGISAIGARSADFGALLNPVNQHPEQVVNAFPILFSSMIFQHIVPTVVTKLEGDRSKISKAIVLGTTFPFLLFLAWNAITLGNVMGTNVVGGGCNPLSLLNSGAAGPLLSSLVGGFSVLVLVSSLIGVVRGLLNGLANVAALPDLGPRFEKWKPALLAASILPPLGVTLGTPDVFFQALDFGGAFGVSTLYLVLTPVIVWEERYGEEGKVIFTKPMTPLGKIPLGSMWKAAATLIVEQGAEKLGLIDFIREHILNL